MSTPEQSVGIQAAHPAERALFRSLFDDAAVFPPGLAPLHQAVTDHVARQSKSYSDLVGPLILPASAVEDLIELDRPRGQLAVTLIGRPGTDLILVRDAASRIDRDPGMTLVGVEIAWSPDWRQALSWGAPLSVEVPRGIEQEQALSEIRALAGDSLVQAKFRTGSTLGSSVPSPNELATFIGGCIARQLGFKLTGGLHHAMSLTTPEGEDQFGFLNIITAVHRALAQGADVPEMESVLSQRDPATVVDIISRMSRTDASVVRDCFTAYGCCAVMDPIGDLASLRLIKETTG